MAHEVKAQACPECGGLMRYEKHDDVLKYQGHKRTIQTLSWWCTKCGEAILTGEPLVRHEKAFLPLKAVVDGVLGPKEVAKVRAALGLSQRKAGEILGGGPRAFPHKPDQNFSSRKRMPACALARRTVFPRPGGPQKNTSTFSGACSRAMARKIVAQSG
jgi:putative zinc finger/helix-turn-helix YgiT family protein